MRIAALLAAFAMVGVSATRADAQVTFTLDNPFVTNVAPGSTVDFIGTIANSTQVPAQVFDFFAQTPFASFDASGTAALVGTTIAPGASVRGTLFSVIVDAGALPGTYSGLFLIDIAPQPPATFGRTLPADFSISVSSNSSTVPEPATLALLAGGLGVLAVVGRRRRLAAR